MRAFAAIALGAAVLAAPVAQACDQEEINHLLTGVCQGALGEAAAAAEALLPRAGSDASALRDSLARARHACSDGDPVAGAAEAARLARLVGRIETRLGEAPPIWPRQQAELAR